MRIFTRRELETKLAAAGLTVGGHHQAHALHSPYWWLKCAVGVHDDDHPLARAYHRLLVWDIMQQPRLTRLADRALNPVLGKSLVVYSTRPQAGGPARPRPGPASTAAGQDSSIAGDGGTTGAPSRLIAAAAGPAGGATDIEEAHAGA